MCGDGGEAETYHSRLGNGIAAVSFVLRARLIRNFMLHQGCVPLRSNAQRHIRFLLILAVAIAGLGALCEPQTKSTESNQTASKPTAISRERAIEIARAEIRFSADSVEAVQVRSEAPGNPSVWRVTFKRRLPDAPPGLFHVHIVEVDVRTGEIVSISIS